MLSAFEILKGYSKPINNTFSPQYTPQEITYTAINQYQFNWGSSFYRWSYWSILALRDHCYPGTIDSIPDDRHHVINYGKGDNETLSLKTENWRSEDTIISNLSSLKFNVPNVLQNMLSFFGNRPFMFHNSQGFPQYAIIISSNWRSQIQKTCQNGFISVNTTRFPHHT